MISTYVIFGRYYGYPSCCVEAFENGLHLGKPLRKLTGTGYVPCSKCNKKSEEKLLLEISQKRICSLPFPQVFETITQEINELLSSHIFNTEEKLVMQEWYEYMKEEYGE